MSERLDGSVVLAVSATAGVIAIVHPWPVLAFAVGVAAMMALGGVAHPKTHVAVLAAAFALACGARARSVVAADEAAAERVARVLPRPERCALDARIVSMPVMRGTLAADVLVESMTCDARAPPLAGARVRVHELHDGAARGDRLTVIAQIAPSRRLHNPDLGDPRAAFARRAYVLSGSAITVEVVERGQGLAAALDRVRARLRDGIARTMAAELSPIARAIVLGEEDLTEEDDEAFRRSGLTHLLAVSGSHVALVVGGLVGLLRAGFLRWTYLARRIEAGRAAALVGVPLACAYEQLSGDSGSARRATVMAVIVLCVRVVGRRPDLPRTIGVSVLAALAIDPLAPFDLSFVLSVAATVGLVALGPFVDRPLARVRVLPRMVRGALAATVAASVACAPFIAGISGSLPVLSVVANVVAVPIGELAALPLCNASAAAGALGIELPARLLGQAASGALVMLRSVARTAAAPESAVVVVPPPTVPQLTVLATLIAALYLLRRRARVAAVLVAIAAFLLCEIVHLRASRPRGILRVTVLDVAQGDSTLIDLPDGRAMLIDAGGEVGSAWDPGRAVVAPVLAARRRRQLDVVALSHPHPDHFLGLPRALSHTSVSAFWHNGQAHSGGTVGALIASLRTRGAAILDPTTLCGPRELGGARVEVLHPCPAASPDRGANDNSLVVRITYGKRHVLLVGDAEHEAESELLKHPASLRADLLKVGHHGSRTSSTTAFLAAVAPSVATISCGARNRFGHPHPAALTSLTASGARVLRTDLDGAITWQTDGEQMQVATARARW